ncbi:hypothetical protein AB5J55_19075 [Streptomyces sp. R11]|uniref:Uncharacterized protein n=1 Tax=Streptomyces sp. R11 TaxID=3238625 RepID=A0AB39MZ40_9ACTN
MSAAHDLADKGQPPSPDRVWELCEFYILGFDVSRLLYGDDGRPLGERYAAARVREGVPYEMRRCPYSGSRSGYDMNVSALRSMQADWPDVLEGVAEIREAFHRRYGHEELDWRWVWVFGRVLTTLPTLYARRSGKGSRTVVPRRIASLYKPSLGLAMTPEYILLAGGDYKTAPSPDEFFRETEDRGVFLTPDAACSGPVRHVREFLEVCLGPRRAPRVRWVAELVDLDDLISYSWANAELELAKYRFLLALALSDGPDWQEIFDSPAPSSFDNRALDELAAQLDEAITYLGFSERIVELGRRDVTSFAEWCELFSDLLVPALDMVHEGSSRPTLDTTDVRLMARHLSRSWRSSGIDAGLELARIPVARI